MKIFLLEPCPGLTLMEHALKRAATLPRKNLRQLDIDRLNKFITALTVCLKTKNWFGTSKTGIYVYQALESKTIQEWNTDTTPSIKLIRLNEWLSEFTKSTNEYDSAAEEHSILAKLLKELMN